jgi:imidazolonepropionase-like amidohydrolase
MSRLTIVICFSLILAFILFACNESQRTTKTIEKFVETNTVSAVKGVSNTNNESPTDELETQQRFNVIFGGQTVGHADVIRNTENDRVIYTVDYAYSNNGRGANSKETIITRPNGVVIDWNIAGQTVFGNAVQEAFMFDGQTARWSSSTESGEQTSAGGAMYISQYASPYSLFLYANALLKKGDTLNALPGGVLSIDKLETLRLKGPAPDNKYFEANIYALKGINLDPSYLVLDAEQSLLGVISPRFVMLKKEISAHDTKLRKLAAEYNVRRFEEIASRATKAFDAPVSIKNVRIFQPQTLSLSGLKTVTIEQNRISNIQIAQSPINSSHVIIDGNGGTLVPGLYEMHGHMSDNQALLNVLAGVTSVRDVGNEINVLDPLVKSINKGQLIGPRITKSGFIEGKSPFSAATGEMAASKEEAVQLVKNYAEMGDYFQIKVYSSVNGDWVPAMAKEAQKHGMRVAGHIPAFSTADEMINAGFDEITHINQVMLSWVLGPDEDTRTLFRITGMKRFADLDINQPNVQASIDLMMSKNIVVDPTIVIHEYGLLSRNGEVRAGVLDYIDNMPVSIQRASKVALLNVADDAEDLAYKKAFDKIIEVLSLMHTKGIFIVPGTDLGGAFNLHRELELFEKIGMSPAEVLKRASYDMADYLGVENDLGSIETGKLADFFLVEGDPTARLKAIKTIKMVAKDGKVYFPSEIYPEFGITPFTKVPAVTLPALPN